MITEIKTEAHIGEGVQYLSAREPRFADVVRICGHPPLRRGKAGLEGLLAIITEQQISVHAAEAIWQRVLARHAPFKAAALAACPDGDFAACGLSRPKIRTIRAVAEACGSGALDFEVMHRLPDDEIMAVLTAIKGIGPWTAEIYLLSSLGRPDVWPRGDLALQEAARLLFALPERPDAGTMEKMSEGWRPWRAVAARLLWSHYRSVKFKS